MARGHTYRDHGRVGAEDLDQVRCEHHSNTANATSTQGGEPHAEPVPLLCCHARTGRHRSWSRTPVGKPWPSRRSPSWRRNIMRITNGHAGDGRVAERLAAMFTQVTEIEPALWRIGEGGPPLATSHMSSTSGLGAQGQFHHAEFDGSLWSESRTHRLADSGAGRHENTQAGHENE